MRDDRRLIEQEDWKKAPGVIVENGKTNSALASRDYEVKCNARYVMVIIKGYHIWWCSAHHQPATNCQAVRAHLAGISPRLEYDDDGNIVELGISGGEKK